MKECPPSPTLPGPVGIGSFCCRNAMSHDALPPEKRMTAEGFLQFSQSLGFDMVLLCENMELWRQTPEDWLRLRDSAEALGLTISLGMGGLDEENLRRHIEILRVLRARSLRIVIGQLGTLPEADIDGVRARAMTVLSGALPVLEDLGVTVGLENHFDLPSDVLVSIADAFHGRIGLICDTTNSLGFIERPEITLQKFAKRLLSVHIKDYLVYKMLGGHNIQAVALGEGVQDLAGLLTMALSGNPEAAVVLEMPVRGEPGMDVWQLVAKERQCVTKSASVLLALLDALFPDRRTISNRKDG